MEDYCQVKMIYLLLRAVFSLDLDNCAKVKDLWKILESSFCSSEESSHILSRSRQSVVQKVIDRESESTLMF